MSPRQGKSPSILQELSQVYVLGHSAPAGTCLAQCRLVSLRKTELAWGGAVATLFAGFAVVHRWIHDDGFINLRIVRNLVAGAGPVFNYGERVEAGTSPLWLALLTVFHALHAPLEWTAVVLGIVFMSAAVLLMPLVQMPERSTAPDLRAPRSYALPVGLLAFAAVPATWDYASAGLETGLACLWLVVASICVTSVVRKPPSLHPRKLRLMALVCGMGPLVRPDFLVYSALFVGAIVVVSRREVRTYAATASVLFAAFTLPVLVQVMRMGYFATLAPNTALAKEAFRANVPQGVCYLKNFIVTYWLGVPLFALTILTARATLRRIDDSRLLATVALVPVLGALLHASYLVMIGGDYMHARLLLPDLIAFAAPASLTRFSFVRSARPEARWALVAAIPTVLWALVCVGKLRPARENVCSIGDEHGWYTRLAQVAQPVRIEDYQRHSFYQDRKLGVGPRELVYEQSRRPLSHALDPHVERALHAGAIGILGYTLPSTVFVVDKHGLADPIVARFELEGRGRPGHEKESRRAWVFARYAEPQSDDTGDVVAARHALTCGSLGALVRNVTEPLTVTRFLRNIAAAPSNHRLRIPPDPFVAEAKFCGAKLTRQTHGGLGGEAFVSFCPPDKTASGVRVTRARFGGAINSVSLLCGVDRRPEATFGERGESTEVLLCSASARLVGIVGSASGMVQRVGLLCAPTGGDVLETHVVGNDEGTPFEERCPPGARAGIAGRAGKVVDAWGVACMEP